MRGLDAGGQGEDLFQNLPTPLGNLGGGAKLAGVLHELRVDRASFLRETASEATTIHETRFFRDSKVWQGLAREVIPRLVEARRREREVRVWCAGCSTGQEVYSAAMLLAEMDLPVDWRLSVLGTDAAELVVEYARRGRFTTGEMMDGLGAERRARHFLPRERHWLVGQRLREMCSFACWNVCTKFPRLPMFDLVLMRNVLPYMDAECRRMVFQDVRRQMADDGRLLLGEMEEAEEAAGSFSEEAAGECFVYRPVASC